MPGIFTHYSFALDAEWDCPCLADMSDDERDAFRLGCQGPDPLLFVCVRVLNPTFWRLGVTMHNERPAQLLAAFAKSWRVLAAVDQPVAKAYARGFLCHYLLDAAVHPLVYAQQYALCGAGVEGLDTTNYNEVHATIEMELDELMIGRLMGVGLDDLDIAEMCLKASDHVLDVISKLYVLVCASVYQLSIPKDHFRNSVEAYRVSERVCDSIKQRGLIPSGAPRAFNNLLPWMRALGHTCQGVESSEFENNEHLSWPHPFGEGTISASFEELYFQALQQAVELLPEYVDGSFGLDAAQELTGGRNFKGASRVAGVREGGPQTATHLRAAQRDNSQA